MFLFYICSHSAFASKAQVFSTLDLDKNGFIDKKEADANQNLTKNFAHLDSDEDGLLGWSEFSEAKIDNEPETEQVGIKETKDQTF